MDLKLQIDIDQQAGFCFGVERAIEMAENILSSGEPLYCLGQIVHNSEEVRRLEKNGMVSITHNDLKQIKNSKVLVRSHGEPPETYEKLRKNNNEIIEATCPIVLKLQERVKRTGNENEFILIFGKKNHPEVIGLAGQLTANYVVFQDVTELDLCRLPKELTLYSQTTMDLSHFRESARYLSEKGFQVTVKDTICRKVSGKSDDLTVFAKNHDVMIMVAGVHSSNGKVLFEVCKAANSRSYKIVTSNEIDPAWFKPNDRVGVSGATSTPRWQMEEIAEHLKSL